MWQAQLASINKTATVELGTHLRGLNSMYRDYGVGKVYKVRDGLSKVVLQAGILSPLRMLAYHGRRTEGHSGSVGGYGRGKRQRTRMIIGEAEGSE